MKRRIETLEEKFLRNFNKGEENECWEWTGARFVTGYGKLDYGPAKKRLQLLAHRFSYEYFVGKIPTGLVIDHMCENRRCVNPKHLDPTTIADNIQRTYDRTGTTRYNPSQQIRFVGGLCREGHKLIPSNVYFDNGHVRCRECRNIYSKKRYTQA